METQLNYLKQLDEWGEAVKESIYLTELTENEQSRWMEQIVVFQEEIKNCLNKNNVTDSELRILQNKGKKINDGLMHNYNNESVSYGKHQLPPLPYSYDALEPYISKEIMRLHHDNHHQSYVDGLNKAEKEIYVKNGENNLLKHWLREQAFHGSGHYLHTIFWNNMTPDSTKHPIKELRNQINQDFGSYQKFKNLFTKAATSVEGVGWAVLVWSPRMAKLGIQSFEKHQLFQIADTIPLLVLDMWEHAYYLQYQTDKEKYVKNWWNVVNWENANQRFLMAKQVKWEKY
ncbi:superoxide dismutase [Oceanobacillus senegalensis]|uniref:superoxide dismutase n=1 Tax=Oceanobacillus senegalensis TaxID=1936063 RepID=UPI000A30CDD6|nr:superoxide dismutase [Oceanobacillus senegalensis]